jgi:hypothetical protein
MAFHCKKMRQSTGQRPLCIGIDPLVAPNDTNLFANTIVQLLLLHDSGLIAIARWVRTHQTDKAAE